jgi:hypothetical protein
VNKTAGQLERDKGNVVLALPMSSLARYQGLTVRRANTNKPWHAQLARKGITFSLGNYATPEEAARAYDNAAFHTRAWSERAVQLNFPELYAGPGIPGPSHYADHINYVLNQKFPEHQKLRQEKAGKDAIDTDDKAFWQAESVVKDATKRQQTVFIRTLQRCRSLQREVDALKREVEKRDLVIQGLQATQNVQKFVRIGGQDVRLEGVEKQLAE